MKRERNHPYSVSDTAKQIFKTCVRKSARIPWCMSMTSPLSSQDIDVEHRILCKGGYKVSQKVSQISWSEWIEGMETRLHVVISPFG